MDKTILVGNGLGLALDPAYFKLQSGIDYVWKNYVKNLELDEISLLNELFKTDIPGPPNICEQNDVLAIAHTLSFLTAHIKSLSENKIFLLNENGIKLQQLINNFIWKIAYTFYNYPIGFCENKNKFDLFFKNFERHLEVSPEIIHTATTNFDNLLYQKCIESKLMDSRKGKFIDGFSKGWHCNKDLIFDEANLELKQDEKLGWYLHLHGSPLFVCKSADSEIIKIKQYDLDFLNKLNKEGLEEYKPQIVLNS